MLMRLAGTEYWIRFPKFRRACLATLGFLPTRRWRIMDAVIEADDVPYRISRHRAVLVSTPPLQKWLVFDCPCGTGHRIMLNLDHNRQPYWRLTISMFGKITLTPSVDYDDNQRRCHYVLRKGRVAWSRSH